MSNNKTPDQVKDDFLSDIRAGLERLGLSNINTSDASYYGVLGRALSNLVSPIYASLDDAANMVLPDSADEDVIKRLMEISGLSFRLASQAYCQILFTTTSTIPVYIPQGARLVATNNTQWQVLVSGSFANNDVIEIVSIGTGEINNISKNSQLTWSAPPVGAGAAIAISDATGGADDESLEQARERYIAHISSPPGSGNATQVIQTAIESSAAIHSAFCYSAITPGSVKVAIQGKPGAATRTRILPPTVVNFCQQYLRSKMPEAIDYSVVSVAEELLSMSIGLSIPQPAGPSANVSVQGSSGWINAQQFPLPDSTGRVEVILGAIGSFGIRIKAAPGDVPDGATRIQMINKMTWKVDTAAIVSCVEIIPGLYDLTLDIPFQGYQGDYVWPACVNAQAYLDELLAYFDNAGPGEITNSSALLSRSERKPLPGIANDYRADLSSVNKILTRPEVRTGRILYTSASAPAVPATTDIPPNVFIPKAFGFYPA